MISAKVFKLENTGLKCDNPDCKHSNEYHWNVLGNVYYMRTSQTCLLIELDYGREFYCRECIDVVYRKLKPVLDSKLWIFT